MALKKKHSEGFALRFEGIILLSVYSDEVTKGTNASIDPMAKTILKKPLIFLFSK